jgi:hypothetical protein
VRALEDLAIPSKVSIRALPLQAGRYVRIRQTRSDIDDLESIRLARDIAKI